jgi:hypothetical protein
VSSASIASAPAGASGRGVAGGDPSGSLLLGRGRSDGVAEAFRREPFGGYPRAGVGVHRAGGDFDLVAPERHHTYGYALGQCLLGSPHAAVGHGDGGAVQDVAVRVEVEDVGVRGQVTQALDAGRHGRDHRVGLVAQPVEGGPDMRSTRDVIVRRWMSWPRAWSSRSSGVIGKRCPSAGEVYARMVAIPSLSVMPRR